MCPHEHSSSAAAVQVVGSVPEAVPMSKRKIKFSLVKCINFG
jgi:hypothetical protein